MPDSGQGSVFNGALAIVVEIGEELKAKSNVLKILHLYLMGETAL